MPDLLSESAALTRFHKACSINHDRRCSRSSRKNGPSSNPATAANFCLRPILLTMASSHFVPDQGFAARAVRSMFRPCRSTERRPHDVPPTVRGNLRANSRKLTVCRSRNLKRFVPQASFLEAIRQSLPANNPRKSAIAQRTMNRRESRPQAECRLNAIETGSFISSESPRCLLSLRYHDCPAQKSCSSENSPRTPLSRGRIRLGWTLVLIAWC